MLKNACAQRLKNACGRRDAATIATEIYSCSFPAKILVNSHGSVKSDTLLPTTWPPAWPLLMFIGQPCLQLYRM